MAVVENISLSSLIVASVIIYLSSILIKALYRILFHPLAKYPGPKLAAATEVYRAYYDIWIGGGMIEQLEALHKQYGPVVRLAPNELHFSEPSAYHDIYTNPKFLKDPWLYHSFCEDESSFGYCEPQLARARRDVMKSFFSRRSIASMRLVIDEKVDKLCMRITEEFDGLNKAVDLSFAVRAATLDIINQFCFGECMDTLDAKEFHDPLLMALNDSLPTFWYFKHFPVVRHMLLNCPVWITRMIGSTGGPVMKMRTALARQLDGFLVDPESLKNIAHPTIYHRLLNTNPKGTETTPTRRSLLDEAQTMLLAGTDTVGNTLSVGVFHILRNPEIHKKLTDELIENWPRIDQPLFHEQLERLPYMVAIIKESLRIGNGTVGLMPRIIPSSGATIGGIEIPRGTRVAMANPFVHGNEGIFPDSKSFIPERWLGSESKDLDHWLVAFSRGPRSCFGMNLAYCELYTVFGNLFRRFEMELHETTLEDMKWKDYFIPYYPGKPVQVFVKRRLA